MVQDNSVMSCPSFRDRLLPEAISISQTPAVCFRNTCLFLSPHPNSSQLFLPWDRASFHHWKTNTIGLLVPQDRNWKGRQAAKSEER